MKIVFLLTILFVTVFSQENRSITDVSPTADSVITPDTAIYSSNFKRVQEDSIIASISDSMNVISEVKTSDDTLSVEETEDKKEKRVKFAGIPMLNYDPSMGLNFGVMGMALYKVNVNDTISPSSATGGYFAYTTNNSWFAIGFQQLYLDEDNWRVRAGLGAINVNYQFYQGFGDLGGLFIDYGTLINFVMVAASRQTFNKLYLGGRVMLAKVNTEFEIPILGNPTDERTMNFVGVTLDYDKRNDVRNATSGYLSSAQIDFYREAIGGDNDFERYQFVHTHTFNLKDEKHILLARAHAILAVGDVPFQGQNVVNRDNIRGYTDGKHRGEQLYSLQSEYRWTFYDRWGMVGFAGIATVVDELSELKDTQLLPGAGVGFRFMAIPSEKINIGIDVAKGKEDYGIYFRVGDTFAQ